MALFSSASSSTTTFAIALFTLFLIGSSSAQLSENFYAKKCPKVLSAVKSVVQSAVAKEPRMGGSLLRLFFHDCFVNVNFSNLKSLLFIHHSYIYFICLIKGNTYIAFSNRSFRVNKIF